MDSRIIIAYSLIAFLVLVASAWAAYARYNTPNRKIARQRRREADARAKRIQDQL
jgi:hypothetical protein